MPAQNRPKNMLSCRLRAMQQQMFVMIVRNGFLPEREVSALHAIWDSRTK
jgi:hypothetical protein